MRHLAIRLLALVLMFGFLISANMTTKSAPLNCNWICWRSCNDAYNECLLNFPNSICCGEFNQCIQSCGTSCVMCEQEPPPEK
jgi:hypothetical protein